MKAAYTIPVVDITARHKGVYCMCQSTRFIRWCSFS